MEASAKPCSCWLITVPFPVAGLLGIEYVESSGSALAQMVQSLAISSGVGSSQSSFSVHNFCTRILGMIVANAKMPNTSKICAATETMYGSLGWLQQLVLADSWHRHMEAVRLCVPMHTQCFCHHGGINDVQVILGTQLLWYTLLDGSRVALPLSDTHPMLLECLLQLLLRLHGLLVTSLLLTSSHPYRMLL